MKDLILIGPQGSGKGTQGKILAEKYGFKIFETGGELRRLAEEDSDLGRKVNEIITRGDLVSNDLVMEIVANFIEGLEGDVPVIFDGIPRSEEQRQSLEVLLSQKGRDFTALEVHVPEDVTFDRLFKRAEIEGRADDNEESIKRRLENYYKHTLPILDKFREEDKLVSVDGVGTLEEIQERIVASL
ncbi:MAG: nucleoside monophosphate kinase [Candidatus Peregrinibacteria bacterium]|nr:nucleoside monophosphate kinase [Candidatus Peregrinibacteria bacterium]